jgi:hypothetical protein
MLIRRPPVALREADTLDELREIIRDEGTKRVLGQHGGARPIRDEIEQGSINPTLEDAKTERGADYLTARLERDAPEIV